MTVSWRARRNGFPPGPGQIASANELRTFFDDPIVWYRQLQTRYGDLVGVRAGPIRMVACFDLDLVQQIMVREPRAWRKGAGLRATRLVLGDGLITSDGDRHRRHRALVAPLFTPRTLAPFADSMVGIASEVLDAWPESGEVATARVAYDISLRIAATALFGCDFDATERQQLHDAMRELNDGYRTAVLPGGQRIVERGLTPGARRMRSSRNHVDRVIRALIAQRRLRDDVDELGDLLSRLLAARNSDDGSALTDEEVRDEAVTMMLAGHDTTAATLSWCLGLLALHPAEQERGRAEVDAVLGARPASTGDLRQLKVIRALVEETLRLHPAVYSTVRDAIEPMDVGGGVVLRPGCDVIIPIGGIHRDPRWWPEPLEYRPQRFLDDAEMRERPKLAYMPFGTGPRICIGSSFALQELVLVVATVLQRFELTAPPGFQLQPHVGFIRRPAGDVSLRVKRRPAAGVERP